jgi:AP-4 complex subunit mu-1
MKSYLRGNPGLRLVLNDDLVIGAQDSSQGGVVLDDCAFHECADTSDFDSLRTLAINPPDGEFLVMSYRTKSDYQTPFRIIPVIEELSQYKLQFTLKIKATCPSDKTATQLMAKFNLPKDTATCNFEIPKNLQQNQFGTHNYQDNKGEWTIKKFQGGQEHTLICKITLKNSTANQARKEIGPVSLSFEIPMFNVSKL